MAKKNKDEAQPTTNPAPVAPTAPTPPAAAPVEPPAPVAAPLVFALTEVATFTPGKGLASELYAVMKTLGQATAQQAADSLLASGAYQRVAPQAAAKRPVKPVDTLLRLWIVKGAAKIVEGGQS